jgi:outer membrane biogenesis lipoprotein LolB
VRKLIAILPLAMLLLMGCGNTEVGADSVDEWQKAKGPEQGQAQDGDRYEDR